MQNLFASCGLTILAGLWLAALAPAADITLPIEVLGPTGTTRSVTVTSSAPATALSLRIHGLAHAGMAEVRVNSGSWIALSNTTATAAGLGGHFGGIGNFATLDLRVPITATPAGSHSISFRFATGDGVTIGFRVLRLDLLAADGRSTVAASSFRNDDPATWTPPLAGTADRSAGEALWRTAALVDGSGGLAIRANCSDCHAQNGRDLAYFNYSNLAIIERSKFHGLNDTQAKQIASYIRSLPGSVHGRPWNPPYPPGPGLTSRPISEWSAGAGIDAVTKDDADAVATVPGATGNAREIIDADGNIREMPIHDMPKAFQFLDWNHWLPRVHPLDVPGFDFNASGAKIEYQRLRTVLSGPNGMDYFERQFRPDVGGGQGENTTFNELRTQWRSLKRDVGVGVNFELDRVVTPTQANHIYSAAVWGQVKLWEMMQEFGLEGLGKVSHGATSPERLWYSHRFVFDASPFLSGLPDSIALFGDGPAPVNFEYINNSWYELQMQLNAGRGGRSSGGHEVIDWGYMANHFGGMFGNSGEAEPVRRSIFALMSMQQHDSGTGPEYAGDGNPGGGGWDIATSPTSLLDFSAAYWSKHPNPKPLIQAILQATAEKHARYTPGQWRRASGHDGFNMPAPDYVLGSDVGEARVRNIAEHYFGSFLVARDTHRIDEPVVNGLAAVGALIWANNDWVAHRRASATVAAPATCIASAGIGSIQITWAAVPNATSYNLYRAVSASGPFAPLQLMTSATTATDRRLAPGTTWYYRVSANRGGGESGATSPIASAGVARGLVARWAFDESGRQIVDASGLGNHGELVGAIQRVPGRHGGALRITARGQFASVPHDLVPSLIRGATVTAWVRSSFVPTDATMTVIGGSHWFGKVGGDGKPRVRIWDYAEVTGTTSVLNGQWHHLAMSHAANTEVRIWVDGVLEGSGRIPVETGGYEIHDLGRGPRHIGGDTTWLGDLDDIRIYDQVLGAAEIRAIMNDDSAGPSAPPDTSGDFRPGVPDTPTSTGSLGGAGGAGGVGGSKGCGLGSSFALLLGSLAIGLVRRRRAG